MKQTSKEPLIGIRKLPSDETLELLKKHYSENKSRENSKKRLPEDYPR